MLSKPQTVRKGLLLLLFVIISFSSFAQSWKWGKEGTSSSDTYSVIADLDGNGYLAGDFKDTISFGSYHLSEHSGGKEVYLVKYDSNGDVLWAKQTYSVHSSFSTIQTLGITIDSLNNVFISGTIQDTGFFGGDTVVTSLLNGSAFVAKYAPNGNLKWVKTAKETTNSGSESYALATDSRGNCYSTGDFGGTIIFDNDTLKAVFNGRYSFLVKYDSSGNVVWAKQSHTPVGYSYVQPFCAATDKSGNVYIGGEFEDTIYFGALKLIDDSLSQKAFLVKYDNDGNEIWAKQDNFFSAYSVSRSNAIVSDMEGDIYLTGYLSDTACFAGHYLMGPYNVPCLFLVKYTSNGNCIWAKQNYPRTVSDRWAGYSLAIDNSNHIYLSGGLGKDTCKFVFGNDSLAITNSRDGSVVLQLDTAGNMIQGSILRTGGDDNNAISCTPSGKYIYFGGDVEDTITFGQDFLTGNAHEQPFISRWILRVCSTYVTACCNTSISSGNTVVLNATPANNYSWSPSIGLSCTNCQSPLATPTVTTMYYVKVSDGAECSAIDSVLITVNESVNCGNLFVPDAFSPNKDGENDVLYVRDNCIATLDFVIFDRWGNKVFETENINKGWDGTYKGQPMNTGTYVYYLKGTLQDGTAVEKKGNVALIR